MAWSSFARWWKRWSARRGLPLDVSYRVEFPCCGAARRNAWIPKRTMATSPTEIKVTQEIAAEHGLTAEEYGRVKQILGREPNITELGIFSVMWSEHCSYKSSKVHLKRLPTRGKLVVQGPGENAGVVDIGD